MISRLFFAATLSSEIERLKSEDWEQIWVAGEGRQLLLIKSGKIGTLRILPGEAGQRSWEIPVDQEFYRGLGSENGNLRLSWNRRRGKLKGGQEVEIDDFSGTRKGLRLARVFFENSKQAAAFKKPEGFGLEVSYDHRFDLKELAEGSNHFELSGLADQETFGGSIGAVPYFRVDGELRFVVCTTSRKDRWIFPKGQPKAAMAARDIALMEAAEEAGIVGEISGEPILTSYNRSGTPVDLLLFPLEVKSLLKVWQETTSRDRLVQNPDELRKLSGTEELEAGIRMVHDRLGF